MPQSFHLSLLARLRAYFVAGVLVTAPVAITFYLVWLVVSFVDTKVSAILPERYDPEHYLPFGIPGLGFVIAVAALILIGAVTAGYIGRLVLRLGEAALARMPVIRSIYGATKQIFETVLAQKSAFREVCLVEYPLVACGPWASSPEPRSARCSAEPRPRSSTFFSPPHPTRPRAFSCSCRARISCCSI